MAPKMVVSVLVGFNADGGCAMLKARWGPIHRTVDQEVVETTANGETITHRHCRTD